MTTPSGDFPDGTIGSGDVSGLDDLDETVWLNQQSNAVIPQFNMFGAGFRALFDPPFDQTADLMDMQNGLQDRLDLLDEISGYGSSVMSKNWQMPKDQWVDVPFDTQLGPMKHVEQIKSGDRTGYLKLKRGGLWRVDLLMRGQGHQSEGRSVLWTNPITGGFPRLVTWTDYFGVGFTYRILVTSGSTAIANREYTDGGPSLNAIGFNSFGVGVSGNREMVDNPASTSFSLTLVIDADPDVDVDVRVKVQARAISRADSGGWFSGGSRAIYGGTSTSSLSVSRWSRSRTNPALVTDPPVAGTL